MIEFHGLVKSHDGKRVLDGVTLAVAAGERAALVGPSGGGKTTLLRCSLGLEVFEAGEVVVDDIRLPAGPDGKVRRESLRQIRRKAPVVFQHFHLFPHLSVLENVLSGPVYGLGRPRDQMDPKARELLARVGLAEKLSARPESLSGGQQQRVAIARALAMNPR